MTTKQPRRFSAQRASNLIQQWVNSGEDQEDDEDDAVSTESPDEDANIDSETEDVVECQISETDDASCCEDDSEPDVSGDQPTGSDIVVSKDKSIEWSKTPVAAAQGRRSKVNIVRTQRGIVTGNNVVDEPSDSVKLYLDDKFFDVLLTFTNKELKRRREARANSDTTYIEDFDHVEIKAAVGLMIIIGVMSGKRESLEQLWSEEYGRAKLRATMPLKRFKTFLASARFDDKTTRSDRQKCDKLAAIRELFNSFVQKCNSLYNPSPFVCVDETLVSFRGRCSFRVYIPSKPDKYGIKVWSLCDCGTNYAYNLQVYLGKQGTSPEQHQGERVVKDLMAPLFGSGRNVTTDNFFTSYNLAQFLLTKQLTTLGTVRKNRREVPRELLPSKRTEYDSVFVFTKDTAMVSYAPKKNRTVLLLSTMHDQPDVNDDEQKKPIMVLDYNATKGAVDAFDQEVGYYTCARKTRRWPMRLFFFIIDAACLNAFVLWTIKNPQWKDHNRSTRLDKRRLFLLEVADHFISPMIARRAADPSISHQPSVAKAMLAINVKPTSSPSSLNPAKMRGRCQSCPRKKDIKSEHRCAKCNNFVCGKHANKTITYSCIACPYTTSEDVE